jgi:hypothetical protein
VSVYLTQGEKIGVARRTVPATTAVAAAAMTELLAGPNEAERAAGLGTAIPTGTDLIDVAVAGGVATVDLGGAYDDGGGTLGMSLRLAQVVYTLTQFPTVDAVRFRIDGAPVTVFSGEGIDISSPRSREDYEGVTPAILVERPAVGEIVAAPLRVTGTANVFEATVSYELVDADDRTVEDGFTTATCGTGCRGTFDVTIRPAPATPTATLRVFEVSAKDGSRVNVVEVPLRYGP